MRTKIIALGIIAFLLLSFIVITIPNAHGQEGVYAITVSNTSSTITIPEGDVITVDIPQTLYGNSYTEFQEYLPYTYFSVQENNPNTALYGWYAGQYSTYFVFYVNLLPNSIAPDSSLTIYINIDTISTAWTYIGAYPNYFSTYGQYDNGADVFTYYANFVGNALNSNTAYHYSNGGYIVNNDIELYTNATTSYSEVYPVNTSQVNSFIVSVVSYENSGGVSGANIGLNAWSGAVSPNPSFYVRMQSSTNSTPYIAYTNNTGTATNIANFGGYDEQLYAGYNGSVIYYGVSGSSLSSYTTASFTMPTTVAVVGGVSSGAYATSVTLYDMASFVSYPWITSVNVEGTNLLPYTVTATANGIVSPYGTEYFLNISGTLYSADVGNNITFSLPVGTYSYTAWVNDNGYDVLTGNYTVVSSNTQVLDLNFTYTGYFINVTETGLPVGYQWSFTLYGELYSNFTNYNPSFSTTNSYIVIPDNNSYGFANGSYTMTNVYASAYTGSYNANVIISGSNITVNITFTPTPATLYLYSGEYEASSNYYWGAYIPMLNESVNINANQSIIFDNLPQNESFDLYIEYPYQYQSFPINFITSQYIELFNSSDLDNITINWVNYNPYGNANNTNYTGLDYFPNVSYVHLSITINSSLASLYLPSYNSGQNVSTAYLNSSYLPYALTYAVSQYYNAFTTDMYQGNYVYKYFINNDTDMAIGMLVGWSFDNITNAWIPPTGYSAYYYFNGSWILDNNLVIDITTSPTGNQYYPNPNTIYWLNVSAQAINLNLTFTPTGATSNLTIVVSGLPNGATWIFNAISLNYTVMLNSQSQIYTMTVYNGIYSYNASSLGYQPISGSFVADNDSITVNLYFIPISSNSTTIVRIPYHFNEYYVIGFIIALIVVLVLVAYLTKSPSTSLTIGALMLLGGYIGNILPDWSIYLIILVSLSAIAFWVFLRDKGDE